MGGLANGNDGPYREEAVYVHLDTGKPPAKLGPKDGDIIWRYDMMDELGVFPHNASNCSVIVWGYGIRLHLQRAGLDAFKRAVTFVPSFMLWMPRPANLRARTTPDRPKYLSRPKGVHPLTVR
ncbi:MAG: hypothetical protein CM1200mP29_11200 [Verrucomicrobiota bacterium]|nr:MAG: hypothetical protein CM1200mP29_11200 [Verrucomicrobiota bacterium]